MGKTPKGSDARGGKRKKVKTPRTRHPRVGRLLEKGELERIQRHIQRGDYVTEDKLEIALERLIEDLKNYDSKGRPIRGGGNGDESP